MQDRIKMIDTRPLGTKDPELLSQDECLRSEVSRIRHKEGLIESELRLRGIRPQ